jgi:hypothetical protein
MGTLCGGFKRATLNVEGSPFDPKLQQQNVSRDVFVGELGLQQGLHLREEGSARLVPRRCARVHSNPLNDARGNGPERPLNRAEPDPKPRR